MSTCTRCNGRLYGADIIARATVCIECERKAAKQAADPWGLFVRVLRSKVRPDGTVHVNDVRELLRGRIEPKQIGLLWRRAKTVGLLAPIPGEAGWEPSRDEKGRNDDKQARVWRATPDLTRAAA